MKLTLTFFLLSIVGLDLALGDTVRDEEPTLDIDTGTIKGKSIDFRGSRIYQFLSIPYAEPPINDLRFKKPIAKKPWSGVIDVNSWGPHCVQNSFPGFNSGHKFDEDCLVLNVFVSQSAVKDKGDPRPVLVWIHGGGFNFGSANTPDAYDGTALAALHDVIVVTVNYRLGPLGFLYAPEAGVPGNMGLWDQRLALQWVKDNIAKFGGDPDRVTIFGESAGSIAVSAHIVSPQSKGLFKNAIMQSGSIYDLERWTFKDLISTFMSDIGCQSKDITQCLSSYKPLETRISDHLMFWPISGDEFLPESPEKIVANKGIDPNVNVLLGTVGNEGAFMLVIKDIITFNPTNPMNLTIPHAKYIIGKIFGKSLIGHYYDRYLAHLSPDDTDNIRLAIGQALGDTILACPTYIFGHDLVKAGSPNVYAYYQSHKPSYGLIDIGSRSDWIPPSHCDDIPMVFGHPLLKPDKFTVEDTILSTIMMDTWATFARDGKLSSIGQQKWSPWTENHKSTIVFDPKKIGSLEPRPAEFCMKNWPFPLEKPYPLSVEPGTFAKPEGEDHHNEL